MGNGSAQNRATGAFVREAARAGDIDRYLAALLAPRQARSDLIALTAFLGEVARIPALVNEPMMGEIRLQWWRDAIVTDPDGTSTGSPVADALRAAIDRHRLPESLFDGLLAARSHDLVPHPVDEGQSVDAYLDATEGNAFRLAAHILGAPMSNEADGALTAAGQACGRVRLLRALPAAVAMGRVLPPPESTPGAQAAVDWAAVAKPLIVGARAWLAEMRRRAASENGVNAAILPAALVEPYLGALQELGPDLARMTTDISPLTRVWRLWRAKVRGRV